MADDAQNAPIRAVAAQSLQTPLAFGTCDIHFTHNPAPSQPRIIRLDDFTDKLVARSTRKAIVAALEFEVGVADTCQNRADRCKTLCPPRPANVPDPHAT